MPGMRAFRLWSRLPLFHKPPCLADAHFAGCDPVGNMLECASICRRMAVMIRCRAVNPCQRRPETESPAVDGSRLRPKEDTEVRAAPGIKAEGGNADVLIGTFSFRPSRSRCVRPRAGLAGIGAGNRVPIRPRR